MNNIIIMYIVYYANSGLLKSVVRHPVLVLNNIDPTVCNYSVGPIYGIYVVGLKIITLHYRP